LILDVGSNKMEKAMLARMKKGKPSFRWKDVWLSLLDSGPAYTSKLEKMLRDMKYSSDLMTEFKVNCYLDVSRFNLFLVASGTTWRQYQQHSSTFGSECAYLWILALLYTYQCDTAATCKQHLFIVSIWSHLYPLFLKWSSFNWHKMNTTPFTQTSIQSDG
jgi:hypothetical protein